MGIWALPKHICPWKSGLFEECECKCTGLLYTSLSQCGWKRWAWTRPTCSWTDMVRKCEPCDVIHPDVYTCLSDSTLLVWYSKCDGAGLWSMWRQIGRPAPSVDRSPAAGGRAREDRSALRNLSWLLSKEKMQGRTSSSSYWKEHARVGLFLIILKNGWFVIWWFHIWWFARWKNVEEKAFKVLIFEMLEISF